jgi:hypothetical protein
MKAFEQSNMNMIAHNRVLPEVGSYILQVDAYMVGHINRQKLNQHFQSGFSVTFSKFGNGSELESSHHYHFHNNSVCLLLYQPSR